jgi:ribosomal protein S18 acetylase RimI-like enzyme
VEVRAAGLGDSLIEPVLQDYRRRYALSEATVLNLLMEALVSRRAQTLVAVEAGQAVGAVISSRQGEQGWIHFLHALPEFAGVEEALLVQAEEELARGGALYCLSATLPLLPYGTLERTFRERGYRVVSRTRMTLDLENYARKAEFPAAYQMLPWQLQRVEEAAVLVEAAHRDSEYLVLHSELAGLAGARHLIDRAVRGEFGVFDPTLSSMVLAGDELAALCLAVWHIALRGQGFVVDLCVGAAHRRKGLARALVAATAQAFRQAGAATLGLAVTLSNQPALDLYEQLGFRAEQAFSEFRRVVNERRSPAGSDRT